MNGADVFALVVAVLLIPIAGLIACVDSALARVSMARAEEFLREARPGAKALWAIMGDRARYTNLLLLLRMSTLRCLSCGVAVGSIPLRPLRRVFLLLLLLLRRVLGALLRVVGSSGARVVLCQTLLHCLVEARARSHKLVVHGAQLGDLDAVAIDESHDLGPHGERGLVELL